MIKKIGLLLTVLLVAGFAGAFFYFDALVTRGIQVAGTSALGTPVTVSSASLSPLSGNGTISDLRIENPAGFNAPYVFELGYVAVNLNPGSVFSDVVVIDLVTIAQPVITYETRITTDNVRALLANLPAGGDGSINQSAAQSSGKQLVIRELQILNPQLNLAAGILSAPIQLPDLILHDIGTDNEAATVAEALRVVLTALGGAIRQADLPSLDLLRDSIETSVQDRVNQAGQAVEEAVENLGNRLRQIGN